MVMVEQYYTPIGLFFTVNDNNSSCLQVMTALLCLVTNSKIQQNVIHCLVMTTAFAKKGCSQMKSAKMVCY